MPVVTRNIHKNIINEELKQRLVDEWRDKSTQEPRPLIIHETDEQGQVIHVYVVWTEWGNLDQRMRSELITEAYWEVFDVKGLVLTVAMGLTPEEAKRMGIRPE